MEWQAEFRGVVRGGTWSDRRSCVESHEEYFRDTRGPPWSSKFYATLLPAILIFNILKFQMFGPILSKMVSMAS